jgi:hypothetical protein
MLAGSAFQPSRTAPSSIKWHVRLIVWCLPFGETHGFAGAKRSGHQVEPATASLRAAVGGKIHIVILRLAGLEIADVV